MAAQTQRVTGGTKTFRSGSTLGQWLRVKYSSTASNGEVTVALAGASDISLGVVEKPVVTSGDPVTVHLRTAQGTKLMVASGAITAGNPVYAAASGKVASSGSVYEGHALGAATADGDVIEVMPGPNTDIAAATAGTTSSSFTVLSGGSTARLVLDTNSATGNFTSKIVPSNLTANRTFTLPDSTGTAATLAGTETFTNKTLTSPTVNTPTLNLTVAALAAAGSAQGDAGAIVSASGAFIHATGADATKGIILPAATAGQIFIIKNSDAANAVLKVYPATGDAINALAANAALSMAAKTSALFVALDTTTWYTLPLLPS